MESDQNMTQLYLERYSQATPPFKNLMNPKYKVKRKNKDKTPKEPKTPRKPRVLGPMAVLDAQGMAYARILKDPCFAPLAHPLYEGSEGAVLYRAETNFTFGSGAADTAGVFLWTPGCFSNTTLFGSFATALDTNVVICASGGAGTYQPGLTYLQANASVVRIVSACIQVMWPGTEFSRQGFVNVGQLNGSIVSEGVAAAVLSPANIRPLLQQGSRIPTDRVEVKFRPFSGDAAWSDPSVVDSTQAQNGCLGVSFSNIPVSTGIRMRLVAVYEYIPKYAQGQAVPITSRSTSGNTERQVINHLDKTDPMWWHNVGTNAGNLGAGIAYGISQGFNRNRGRDIY